MREKLQTDFERLLASYLHDPKEENLYGVQQLNKWIMDQKIPPDEVLNHYIETLKKLIPDLHSDVKTSFDLLLEVMVGYGVQYRVDKNIATRHQELEDEIEVAVHLQRTLLPESPPPLEGVDLGVASYASKTMSGDYYNFVQYGDGVLGIAIADIIGKGIPAALCMSMIKYSMDDMDYYQPKPSEILQELNTVVERNILPNMFITMVYGVYDSLNHSFRYATAGHEPGFIYRADTGQFEDMDTQGLVLGVTSHVEYPEFQLHLAEGDVIILLTDGVTETRFDGEFIERSDFCELAKKYLHLPAQEIAEKVYKRIYELSGYQMLDDQTIMVIKREGKNKL
ncbi:sigma-B regulation protein RsbU (phosphoserine phosphatase) [Croceifilum oryzae]|uniref:Sigma-B regulation protein RsbU (Phosphoserine phosphatase) n=1 Tax=Croceifilum oryzae TaxID=1553429 RepID=A0AAJ1TL00_9BACL|nr:PP2C family protein-serine/threonine phosphatase [Croceifilum oryzae]MDQ0418427.1 sigma-B regulation protein RsbU (phosphoserine phosphatase) [Croceifilum oryzae]